MGEKNNPNANDIIRADLTKALRNCEDSAGSFYSLRTYSDAPNPCILMEGRGVLGLPLSKSEGERLLPSVSQQTPTTSRMTTRASCSLSVEASKIHIRNLGFEKFLNDKVVPAVCSDLGVRTWITRPLDELHTMFLCTSGSRLVPCHDPKPEPTGTFGKLLVFLPSEFAGGSLQLSRDGYRSEYRETTELESNSAISTTALAWFNGVSVNSLPVLTGYRLVLSYHLIQTSPIAILPGLDVQAEGVEGVRQVLLRWMQKKKGKDANSIAEVLYYIWDEDPRLTAQITPLALELGVSLYRAEVEFFRSGSVTEPGDYQARRTDVRRRGDYGNGDEGQNDDVEFDEIHTEEFRIQKLTSLNGEIVKGFKEIPFEESMVIPMDFKDELDKPDKREYGGIWDSKRLRQWFYRDALVISSFQDLADTRTTIHFICEGLLKTEISFNTRKDETLADGLVEVCLSGKASIIDVKRASTILHELAMRWKAPETWVKALSVCPQGTVLECIGIHGFAHAYKLFGSKFYELAKVFLPADTRLARDLHQMAKQNSDKDMSKWCQDTMLETQNAQQHSTSGEAAPSDRENSPPIHRTKRRKVEDESSIA